MKLEKLPSGSYRIRKMVKGKKYEIIFDHKPSQKEVTMALAEKMEDGNTIQKGTFEKYAYEYVENRMNVLSPSTVRSYNLYTKMMSDDFKKMNLYDITQEDVQKAINEYAIDHAPKTVRNMHGFIASVLGVNRPNLHLSTTLPQNEKKARYLPSESDIKHILNASEDSEDHVAFQLGVLSLRRAEICALTLSDLEGNNLSINKNLVMSEDGWVLKPTPKTDSSNRIIVLPESLSEEIRKQGFIYKLSPKKLNLHLHEYQSKLGIPEFRFHDLRHYFASYAHSLGIPDAEIMKIGGWSTDHVMKSVYREAMEEQTKKDMQTITSKIIPN